MTSSLLPLWESTVYLAVAGGVFDGAWDLVESVSEGFLTYSFFIFVGMLKYHVKGSFINASILNLFSLPHLINRNE